MSYQAKLWAVAAVICFALSVLLRGVETFFSVVLAIFGVVLIFLSFAFRE